jgi:hypothetical protein
MAESWDHSLAAQITAKMHELVGCMCVVNFEKEGERRGMIERIESLTLGSDFAESFEQTAFRVHLTSGDVVTVAGSAIPAIESTTADSVSTYTTKQKMTRKAMTKKKPRPALVARKRTKEAGKARSRGKERPAQAHRARRKRKKAK